MHVGVGVCMEHVQHCVQCALFRVQKSILDTWLEAGEMVLVGGMEGGNTY